MSAIKLGSRILVCDHTIAGKTGKSGVLALGVVKEIVCRESGSLCAVLAEFEGIPRGWWRKRPNHFCDWVLAGSIFGHADNDVAELEKLLRLSGEESTSR